MAGAHHRQAACHRHAQRPRLRGPRNQGRRQANNVGGMRRRRHEARAGRTTYGWGEVEHKANLGGGSVSYGQKVYRSTILGNPKYDAARKHWGGKWRMPTVPELYMLIRKCTWEQAEMNGQRGFLLTSLKNGNMLFLPSLGSDDIYCDYWSTDECDMEDKLQACKLNAEGASSWRDRVVIGRSLRTNQLPIRAVFIP